MANRPKFTAKKRNRFLEVLAAGGSVTKAAEAVGLSRRALYNHRREDEGFAQAWEDAVQAGTDLLEDEAWRRAFAGVERRVHYRGQRIDVVREYSDTMAIFLLKARRPEKYRERSDLHVSGEVRNTVMRMPPKAKDAAEWAESVKREAEERNRSGDDGTAAKD